MAVWPIAVMCAVVLMALQRLRSHLRACLTAFAASRIPAKLRVAVLSEQVATPYFLTANQRLMNIQSACRSRGESAASASACNPASICRSSFCMPPYG